MTTKLPKSIEQAKTNPREPKPAEPGPGLLGIGAEYPTPKPVGVVKGRIGFPPVPKKK